MKHWFHRVVLSRRWLTFLVMGLAFFVFGAGTFNIAMLFSANAEFVGRYGWQAVLDGAAVQFAELIATGYLSMAAYVIFKVCEYRLARDLADGSPPPGPTATAAATKSTGQVTVD